MKTLVNALIISVILSFTVFSQTFKFSRSIGNFKQATSFYITSAGILYVTDGGTNEIYKLDTLGNVLKYTGGFGWDEGQFDTPSDVFANPLSVYVCDKNNSRVESFDKDLNYVSSLHTRNSDNKDERFGYPLSCALSQQGDLYILDSENKRIVKFDLFGNFVQNFGGYDAGSYALSKPKQLAVSLDNKVYVLDGKRIIVFDQYGNNLNSINLNIDFIGIRILFNNLTLTSPGSIYYSDLRNPDLGFNKLTLEGISGSIEIINSLIFNGKLYLLTADKILILREKR